jgi:hypothetical protein
MSTVKAKRPGAGVKASPGSASPDQRQSAPMRPLAAYFKNLKLDSMPIVNASLMKWINTKTER